MPRQRVFTEEQRQGTRGPLQPIDLKLMNHRDRSELVAFPLAAWLGLEAKRDPTTP